MDFFEVIEKRHSYRGEFEDTAIPKEHIVKILDAGIRAPSGLNVQPVRFVAVTDPDLRAKIGEILPHKHIKTAPLHIIVLSSDIKAPGVNMSFEVVDYGAATENVMLALTALGYASVWIDGEVKVPACTAALVELLNIPAGWTLRCLLPVGVPKNPGKQNPKKPFDERVQFEKFD